MSKSIYLVVCFAAVFASQSLNAQQSDIALDWKRTVTKEDKNGSSIGYLNDLNMRAVRHVEKTYNPDREFWIVTKAGYRVKFQKDSVLYRVDYYKSGRWRHTIKSYGAGQAPKQILSAIKPFLDDYNITLITELTYGTTVSYFINLDGFKRFKTIRVVDGDIELLTDRKKVTADARQLAYDPFRRKHSHAN